MALTKLATNYTDYNFWNTQKFTKWLSTKPDEILTKEVPSSFSTILKTIKHISDTEEYWYSILAEEPKTNNEQKVEDLSTEQIMDGWLKSSQRLSELIHSFSEKDLMKLVKIESPWFQCELPKYEYLMQVINHGTYHRGQIVTIGRNVGITDATNTDYNFYNVVKQSEQKE
ncbi:DinB family protein [Tenacibaculum caenipelagi]|uniref:Putative damage-inducible protein DinB n=1 Tax=Tenacibaculum caenipelagi TaxID=1325435 RepID=A0A4R6TBT7_9FLAO|nr:DinB family protein [Tenacibaculum caenipelagi]TDQ25433.1 putative damage-inducible protein DinB [Tenacibaculum caenipelagi]